VIVEDSVTVKTRRYATLWNLLSFWITELQVTVTGNILQLTILQDAVFMWWDIWQLVFFS